MGTVSLDTGIKWGVTHAIAPDIDTERDLLVSDLERATVIVAQQRLRARPAPARPELCGGPVLHRRPGHARDGALRGALAVQRVGPDHRRLGLLNKVDFEGQVERYR